MVFDPGRSATQCTALETELEELLRRSTDIPPLFFVGYNLAGAFRISTTSRGDGTFDLEELGSGPVNFEDSQRV